MSIQKKRHYFHKTGFGLLELLDNDSMNVIKKFGHVFSDPKTGNIHVRAYKNANHNTNN